MIKNDPNYDFEWARNILSHTPVFIYLFILFLIIIIVNWSWYNFLFSCLLIWENRVHSSIHFIFDQTCSYFYFFSLHFHHFTGGRKHNNSECLVPKQFQCNKGINSFYFNNINFCNSALKFIVKWMDLSTCSEFLHLFCVNYSVMKKKVKLLVFKLFLFLKHLFTFFCLSVVLKSENSTELYSLKSEDMELNNASGDPSDDIDLQTNVLSLQIYCQRFISSLTKSEKIFPSDFRKVFKIEKYWLHEIFLKINPRFAKWSKKKS